MFLNTTITKQGPNLSQNHPVIHLHRENHEMKFGNENSPASAAHLIEFVELGRTLTDSPF